MFHLGRIVWDIFPGSRFISLTSAGAKAVEQLNSWHDDQSLSAIMHVSNEQFFLIIVSLHKGIDFF